MNSHKRSMSKESESGWESTVSTETHERESNNSETTSPLSITRQNALNNIILDEEGSDQAGTFFVDEHHSNDDSSIETAKSKRLEEPHDQNLSPASVAGIVDEVLLSLKRGRQEGCRSASRAVQGTDAVLNTTAQGIEELVHTLKTYPHLGLPTANAELLRRVEDFHRARFLRRQENPIQPWGIFGLFQYLSDLQLDLEWAEDAAWRRMHQKVYLSWSDFQAIHSRTRPPVYFVYAMTLISTALLLFSFHMNGWTLAPIPVNPMLGPGPDVLFDLGALERTAVLENDEWFRLVAPVFLHAGLIHFALNMFALFFIGGMVERRHGTPETVLVFLVTAIGGNMASTLFMSPSISVGASGGIFGLLGLCLADVLINWDLLTLKNYRDILDPAFRGFPYRSVLVWLTIELIMNALVGLTPYVDQFCHVAGLLLGFGFGIPFLKWLKGSGFFGNHPQRRYALLGVARFSLFTITLASFLMMAFSILESDGGTVCESCRYISCLPFPFWKQDTWWKCDDCDLTIGRIDRFEPTTVVNLTCPNSDIVQVDLVQPYVERVLIEESLSAYCREYCPTQQEQK